MKRILVSCLLLAMLASACNNRKREVTVTNSDGTKTTVDVGAAEQALSKTSDRTAELQKLKPYTTEELKNFFPETLNGAKRISYSANSAIGAAMANAEYKLTDTSSYELTVMDCAGEAGAGVYGLQYLTMMNAESESETEHSKSIDFQGGRAFEQLQKADNTGTLIWLAKDRLMVTLKGEHTGLDAVKQTAGNLKF